MISRPHFTTREKPFNDDERKQKDIKQKSKFKLITHLNLRFRCTEIITSAFPSTAPIMIVPKIKLFTHKIVNSSQLCLSSTTCSSIDDVETDEDDDDDAADDDAGDELLWKISNCCVVKLKFPK